MGWLFLLALVGLIVWLVVRTGKSSGTSVDIPYWQLQQRNREWVQFIAGYEKVAENAAQKKLIRRMLEDIRRQGLATIEQAESLPGPVHAAAKVGASATFSGLPAARFESKRPLSVPMDNPQ